MKPFLIRSMACFVVSAGLCVSSFAAEPGHAYSLFDGKTLHGWTVENGCEITVEDGAILLKGGDGWLRSNHQYADFKLHLEWKALKEHGYDAGIFLRTAAGGKPFPKSSTQSNLLEGKEGNIRPLPGATSTGLIKPGEWNSFDYTVIGDTVELAINGRPAYKATGLKTRSGHIGLQCEVPLGGQFLFRNIQITELGYQSLFDGKSLAGWEGAGQPAETSWIVRDDAIQCTGVKGPWLRSQKEYGDFNLRLEYQVSPGGNSGLYIRVPADGNHHRDNESEPPAGFEVQVLDDTADKYKYLKDYQYTAGVYDFTGPTVRVGKPVGEWNILEINCHAHHIMTTLNGVPVVDVTLKKHPHFELRKLNGFIGLQNHNTVVKFRNLRIGPSMLSETATTSTNDILAPSSKVTKVAGDCKFTEGPAVDPQGNLLWSDGRNDRIMKRSPEGEISVYLQPCGVTNGMIFDAEGRLVMCQSSGEKGGRAVARQEKDGLITMLAAKYNGRRFIAPNDLCIDRQGRIYFTDPYYGPPAEKSQPTSGVYRIDAPGKVTLLITDLLKPNGILITPDNKFVYVSDRGTQKLHRYAVQKDASLKPAGIVYDFAPDRGVDGMCLDVEGNIYAAAGQGKTTGLFVVSPAGKLLLHKPMPEFSANVTFGGKDGRDLYLTATTSVYHMRTVKRGIIWPARYSLEK